MNNEPLLEIETSGKYVERLRYDMHLSQLELADLMGVSERTVRRWEAEEAPMPLSSKLHLEALEKLHQLKIIL